MGNHIPPSGRVLSFALLAACEPGVGQSADATTTGAADPPTTTGAGDESDLVLGLNFRPVKRFAFSWTATPGAEHYRLFERQGDVAEYVQIGDDVTGRSVSLTMPLHLRWGASYSVRACGSSGCVDSEPVDVTDPMVSAIGYFKASNTAPDAEFGTSVALSADGTTLAVGAGFENSDAAGINGTPTPDGYVPYAGAVYVFVNRNDEWSQQAHIKTEFNKEYRVFGSSVALSADGDVLAVGARRDSAAPGIHGSPSDETDTSEPGTGAVYVFERADGDWSQQAYVKAFNGEDGDEFGTTVALSANGGTLAVGAPIESSDATGIDGDPYDNSAGWSGAVYTFERVEDAWVQQAYIKGSNSAWGYSFGESIALSADGGTLAVGAAGERSASTGVDGDQTDAGLFSTGAVYVFGRAGDIWSQRAYVKASNAEEDDQFGTSVALSADGNTLAVGAWAEDSSVTGVGGDQTDNSAGQAGAVYMFERAKDIWSQRAYIKASNAGAGDEFGGVLALSADGEILAVGAMAESGAAAGIGGDQADDSAEHAGAVYVFRRTPDCWAQRAYVKASNPEASDFFGAAMALPADGGALAVASQWENSAAIGIGGDQADDLAPSAGAVYLY